MSTPVGEKKHLLNTLNARWALGAAKKRATTLAVAGLLAATMAVPTGMAFANEYDSPIDAPATAAAVASEAAVENSIYAADPTVAEIQRILDDYGITANAMYGTAQVASNFRVGSLETEFVQGGSDSQFISGMSNQTGAASVVGSIPDLGAYSNSGDLTTNLIVALSENQSLEYREGQWWVLTTDEAGFVSEFLLLNIETTATTEDVAAQIRNDINRVAQLATELAAKKATASIVYDQDSEKFNLDAAANASDVVYVDVDAETAQKAFGGERDLIVKLRENQIMVLNFNLGDAAMTDLYGYEIDYVLGNGVVKHASPASENDATLLAASKQIVLNFADHAGAINIAGSVAGSFIAPRAYVVNLATSTGQVVANEYVSGSGEWHYSGNIKGEATTEVEVTINTESQSTLAWVVDESSNDSMGQDNMAPEDASAPEASKKSTRTTEIVGATTATPKTDDASVPFAFAGIAFLAAGALALLRKFVRI